MNIPVPELIIASLISIVMISPDNVDIAGMIRANQKPGEHFSGTWQSYSPTRFGALSMEFAANGECQIRKGANETFSCKWQATENGRAKIRATVSGKIEVLSASVTGDYLVVMDPGREIPFVRANSKAAHERQKLANGPPNFTLPW